MAYSSIYKTTTVVSVLVVLLFSNTSFCMKKKEVKSQSARSVLNREYTNPAPDLHKEASKQFPKIGKSFINAIFTHISTSRSKRRKEKRELAKFSFSFEENFAAEFESDDEDSLSTSSNEEHYIEDNWVKESDEVYNFIQKLSSKKCKEFELESAVDKKQKINKDQHELRSAFFNLTKNIDDNDLRSVINKLNKQENKKIVSLLSGPYKKNSLDKKQANIIINWALFQQTEM